MSAASPEPPGLDELRRRLYGPGASAEDVARYEAATGGQSAAPAPGDAPAQRSQRGRGPWVAIGATVIAVVIAVSIGIAAERPAASPTPSSSSPSPAASPGATIVLGAVPVAASVRATFVSALDAGGEAGLLPFLFRHPDLLPPALRTVTRADSTEYAGDGPATIALSPSALAERGGRATVIIVLARAGRYDWRASRPHVGKNRSAIVVAAQGGEVEAGSPVSATFGYGRGAPTRLVVRVPSGTRWGAVVVFTD